MKPTRCVSFFRHNDVIAFVSKYSHAQNTPEFRRRCFFFPLIRSLLVVASSMINNRTKLSCFREKWCNKPKSWCSHSTISDHCKQNCWITGNQIFKNKISFARYSSFQKLDHANFTVSLFTRCLQNPSWSQLNFFDLPISFRSKGIIALF